MQIPDIGIIQPVTPDSPSVADFISHITGDRQSEVDIAASFVRKILRVQRIGQCVTVGDRKTVPSGSVPDALSIMILPCASSSFIEGEFGKSRDKSFMARKRWLSVVVVTLLLLEMVWAHQHPFLPHHLVAGGCHNYSSSFFISMLL